MSSIYLPEELKQRLVRAARRRGYEVKQGPQSRLAEYLAFLVEQDEKRPDPHRQTLNLALGLLAAPDKPAPTDQEVEAILQSRRDLL